MDTIKVPELWGAIGSVCMSTASSPGYTLQGAQREQAHEIQGAVLTSNGCLPAQLKDSFLILAPEPSCSWLHSWVLKIWFNPNLHLSALWDATDSATVHGSRSNVPDFHFPVCLRVWNLSLPLSKREKKVSELKISNSSQICWIIASQSKWPLWKLERQVNAEKQGLLGAEACGWSQYQLEHLKGSWLTTRDWKWISLRETFLGPHLSSDPKLWWILPPRDSLSYQGKYQREIPSCFLPGEGGNNHSEIPPEHLFSLTKAWPQGKLSH